MDAPISKGDQTARVSHTAPRESWERGPDL